MSGGYFSPDDRRPPITPALAVRVATLGFVALALFAIIFFRLWFLQVLAGDSYLSQANQNRVRDVAIAAPRGDIIDRNGNTIVRSRLANVVQIDPRSLPVEETDAAAEWGQRAGKLAARWKREQTILKAKRAAAGPKRLKQLPKLEQTAPLPAIPPIPASLQQRFAAIGRVLDMRPRTIQRRVIQSLAVLPYGMVKLRIDVPRSVVQYLQERKASYRGIESDRVYVRQYPKKTLAAQLLGNVGEVDPTELKKTRFRGVRGGAIVGKDGVEYTYDAYLRGEDGARRLQVDSLGNFFGELTTSRRNPKPGRDLRLSIDLGVQEAAQRALQRGIRQARANGNPATSGAFVAMNPSNGQVFAMGSEPSFDPTLFTKPISDETYKALNSDESGQPLVDRAVSSVYPTGSTFKPITALAAMHSGKSTPETTIQDNGCMMIGAQKRCNAKETPYGSVNLVNALRVSSDIYFYTLGIATNSARTEIIQSMARKLGLGRYTGIDLPSGSKGLVPDWRWRRDIAEEEAKCRRRVGVPLGEAATVLAGQKGCGRTDMRQWTIGDNVSLAVGQGDLQASPLQMAVAYSAIVSRGSVPRPHLGLEIDDSQGNFLQRIQPPPARRVRIDETARAAVLEGLRQAAQAPGGTSTAVWAGGSKPWDMARYPVYGKTGTAQTQNNQGDQDQSWYVCWIRDAHKPKDAGVVIAVTIERGGFGAESAAPVARLIASKLFGVKSDFVVGNSETR